MDKEEIRRKVTNWLDQQLEIKASWQANAIFNFDGIESSGVCELNGDKVLHVTMFIMDLLKKYATQDGEVKEPYDYGKTMISEKEVQVIRHDYIYKGWTILAVELVREENNEQSV